MTYPEIKLVDSPTASATVLFDFNDNTATPKREVTADDFTIGVPELVGDVDAVDPLYGERLVSFTCAMTGTKPAVAAAQSTLARRLLSGQGWLRVQMTPTSRLLFFRTYRAQPGDLSFEFIQSVSATRAERWEVRVNLPCEPFAYGERVTLPSYTVNNDPAAGIYPQRVVLPDIVGDAPAPLRIALSPNNRLTGTGGRRWMISAHAGPVARTTVLWQIGTGDGFNVGTNTGAAVANASYTGGSYRPVAFANSVMNTRIHGTAPSSVAPGLYKVLVRVARSDTDTTFALQYDQYSYSLITLPGGPVGKVVRMDAANDSSAGFATWVDVGDHHIPYGYQNAPSDVATSVAPQVNLSMARTSGTGSAYLDAILLVPVEIHDSTRRATFMYCRTPNITGLGEVDGYDVFDGDTGSNWKLNPAQTAALPVGPLPIQGKFPEVVPGEVNVLTVLMAVYEDSSSPRDRIGTGATSAMVVSYHPRWLYVGDS